MVTFKQLIQVAPFPDDQKQKLIENIDKLTDDQKFRITNVAWKALSQMYFATLKAERQLIMDEVVHDKRKFNQNDFEEAEAKLLHEFAEKLKATETQETIKEVRQQLEKYKSKPLSTDHLSSTPSVKE